MRQLRSPLVIASLVSCLLACHRRGTEQSGAVRAPGSSSAAPLQTAPAPVPSIDKLANAEPLLIAGKPTGYVTLPSGLIVRQSVQECPSQLPTRGCPNRDTYGGACQKDSDCQQSANGYCHRRGLEAGCSCDYGCTRDEQCGTGRVCVCGNPVGVCVDARCDEKTACTGVCSTFLKDGGYAPMACREHAEPSTRSD